MKKLTREIQQLLGVPRNASNHREKIISALGASLAIWVVASLSVSFFNLGWLEQSSKYMIIASMGASAVLLFAVPHGALSQPWAVIGGHLISAFIGVSCYLLLGGTYLSAALAVGVSVGAMYYLRCIHPPGGATAFTAVMTGAAGHSLSYQFIVVPVLVNIVAILTIAVIFNYLFRWRRYPAHLYYRDVDTHQESSSPRDIELTQEDFTAAIEQQQSFVDITEEGLIELLELAKQHAEMNVEHPSEIIAGKCYSNGKLGRLWSVRQIYGVSKKSDPAENDVIYKVVAGNEAYNSSVCRKDEFRQWARFEVTQRDNRWVKVIAE